MDEVYRIWKSNKCVYGLRRILKVYREIDPTIGARKLRNIMNILKIQGKQDKKFRISTTDSNHENRIARDLVQREFTLSSANKVWVSDVTYFKSLNGWIYLCVILDLYSRKIVGWSISKSNDSGLVCDTLRKAILNRNPSRGLIFHSDRGSNYTSNDTRLFLALHKIRRSNSRKRNCWDNAVAESFLGTLKREIEYSIFNTLKEAKEYFFDYLEVFYKIGNYSWFSNTKPPNEDLIPSIQRHILRYRKLVGLKTTIFSRKLHFSMNQKVILECKR